MGKKTEPHLIKKGSRSWYAKLNAAMDDIAQLVDEDAIENEYQSPLETWIDGNTAIACELADTLLHYPVIHALYRAIAAQPKQDAPLELKLRRAKRVAYSKPRPVEWELLYAIAHRIAEARYTTPDGSWRGKRESGDRSEKVLTERIMRVIIGSIVVADVQ